jgi:hypothetical protein
MVLARKAGGMGQTWFKAGDRLAATPSKLVTRDLWPI